MPEQDGFALMEQLRADPRTRDARLVVVSAFTDMYRAQLEAAQPHAVFHKPVDPVDLVEKVQSLLKSR